MGGGEAVGEQSFVGIKVGSFENQLGSRAATVSEHIINVQHKVVLELLPHLLENA